MQSRRLLERVTLAVIGSLLASSALAADNSRSTVKLIMFGDVMFANDEETGKMVARGENPFQPFAEVLKGADVAIANLECVVAEHGEKVEKPYNFLASPTCLPLLKEHFAGFSVANNHSGDYG